MKDQILKIAKVKSEKEFYKKYPSEAAFMKAHSKEFKKAAMGASMVNQQLDQLTDFSNTPMAQNGKSIDSTGIYTRRMLSNMDMADRSSGELKNIFTKEWEKNAADLERYKQKTKKQKGKAQYGAGIIPFEDARTKAQATILGITPEELMKRREAEASQANQSSGGGANDIISQLASFITPEMIAGLAAKDGYSLSKAYSGDVLDTSYIPMDRKTLAAPNISALNKKLSDPAFQKQATNIAGNIKPKAGFDFKGAGMSALSALPSLIGDAQAIGERNKQKKELRKGVDVSDLVRRAAESRPIYQPNQQISKPWDIPIQPGELYNSYGSTTNFLSAANGTQIQNTYAPTNTLYDDLGYEPLNESDVKQYDKGGKVKKAQFGIDMLAAPAGSLGSGLGSSLAGGGFKGSPEGNIGSTLGSIAGQFLIPIPGVGAIIGGALGGAIGGFIGGDEQRQMEELQNQYSNNTDLAAGQSVIQGIDQQFGGSRRDGGSVGFEHYTPPSAEALQTYKDGGYMAMGGDLQVHQGKAETISYNPFLPKGGETVIFKGPSHANGGMDISYGQNGVEVEGGEPATVLKDGGNIQKDDSLVIYGNIKFDKTGAEQLGDPKAEGQKIKNYMNNLSKFENKQSKLREKGLKLIDETDLLKMGTVQAIDLGTTMNFKTAAQRKIDGAAIQEAYNKTAKEYGYADAGKFIDDVRKGSVKQLKPIDDSETAQNGAMLNDSISKALAKMKAQGKGIPTMKSPTALGVIDPVTQELANLKSQGKAIASKDFTKYGQMSTSSLPQVASASSIDTADTTTKNDRWKDILGAVSSVVPILRPSNAQPLDPSQLSGEMLALASNQLEGVQAQSFQPMLDQPYDISLQDQINMIDSQTNAAIRAIGNDPSAQSQIMANAIEAKSKVLGEQFRTNQANKAGIYSKNRDLINQSKLTNLQIFDKQYERQSQAKSNTKAQAIGALNSINSKIAQNKLENKRVGVNENLTGYRFGPNGQAYNLNGLAQFNMQGSPFNRTDNQQGITNDSHGNKLYPIYNKDGSIKGYTAGEAKYGAKIKARNGSIVKALKSL